MRCKHHTKFQGVSLVEEMLMNYSGLPEYMEKDGWRRYRIEYGHECSCPEGIIYLPRDVDSEDVEQLFYVN